MNIGISYMHCIIGNTVGSLQCQFVEHRGWLGVARDCRDEQTIKIVREMEAAQDRAQSNAPIGDDAQRVLMRLEGFQCWYYVGVDLPTGVLVEFLGDR